MSFSIGYSQNDVYYDKADYCVKNGESYSTGNTQRNSLCLQNEEKSKRMKQLLDKHSGTMQKYNDTKKYYNRELLYTINLAIGIGLLSYYFYTNRKLATTNI
jgi:hypothetical protein